MESTVFLGFNAWLKFNCEASGKPDRELVVNILHNIAFVPLPTTYIQFN